MKEVGKKYISTLWTLRIPATTQSISSPFTPEKGQHNTRCAFGRFEKTSKIKKTRGESFSKGYKIWLAQRKLNH